MRALTPVSRRWFGQCLGACLTLAATGRMISANEWHDVIEVRVSDFIFAPDRLEIHAGDTVVWVNEDLAPHTATSIDGRWDTGSIGTAQEARVTFATPGVFRYICAFHPHMNGEVVVHERASGCTDP